MGRRPDLMSRDFFEVPAAAPIIEGSQDWRGEVSQLVAGMLAEAANAGKDRHMIAADMARLSGHEVSKSMLDGYASPARDTFNIPFVWAPLLEVACDSITLSNWLVGKRGGKMLIGLEAINAEIGRWERVQDEASRRVRDLKAKARVGA